MDLREQCLREQSHAFVDRPGDLAEWPVICQPVCVTPLLGGQLPVAVARRLGCRLRQHPLCCQSAATCLGRLGRRILDWSMQNWAWSMGWGLRRGCLAAADRRLGQFRRSVGQSWQVHWRVAVPMATSKRLGNWWGKFALESLPVPLLGWVLGPVVGNCCRELAAVAGHRNCRAVER